MAVDEIDTSLRTEDLLLSTEDVGSKENSKEISIDLDNMLQEIQDERDSGCLKLSSHPHVCDDECSSHDELSLGSETNDDFDVHFTTSPQHIGSSLKMDELPSSNRFEHWWMSGSMNLKESFGSFKKKMGSSIKKLHYYHQRRKGGGHDSSLKGTVEDDIEAHHSPQQHSPSSDPQTPWRKKKTVRFKKFDTVFPFYKSFSRLKMQHSEDELDPTASLH